MRILYTDVPNIKEFFGDDSYQNIDILLFLLDFTPVVTLLLLFWRKKVHILFFKIWEMLRESYQLN